VKLDIGMGRAGLSVAGVVKRFRRAVPAVLLAAAIPTLASAALGADAESDRPRVPKIEERDPAPWLEYYRRERGTDWPSPNQGESGRPVERIVAPASEPSTAGSAAGEPERGPEVSPPAQGAGSLR
jgi:hypothetical protein